MKATQILKIPVGLREHFFPNLSGTALSVAIIPSTRFEDFCRSALEPELPIHLKNPEQTPPKQIDYRHKLRKYASSIMQYEYRPSSESEETFKKAMPVFELLAKEQGFQLPDDIMHPEKQFYSFSAPLHLVLGSDIPRHSELAKIGSLYIAQMPINDLPSGMQELFPAPMDIIKCGKGDIYGSSVWIGNPPLYTPLHKDPNPNIFTQHLSSKVIRLMRPEIGLALFSKIQSQLGTNSSASFRGDEMMEGPEYLALKKAVWDDKLNMEHYEAHVQPGESFFIPKGWWHSLKSYGKDLNISSNWWFR